MCTHSVLTAATESLSQVVSDMAWVKKLSVLDFMVQLAQHKSNINAETVTTSGILVLFIVPITQITF